MKALDHYKYFDIDEELEDYEDIPSIRNLPHRKERSGPKKASPRDEQAIRKAASEIENQLEGHDDFSFSYQASRHEQTWLLQSLGVFFHDDRWIADVLRLVKGGKEASVYLCTTQQTVRHIQQPYLAAKVYRPRMLRNLRKDHLYREGRANLDIEGRIILNDGMLHAMQKKSAYGQELLHTSWIGHEFKTMQILHAAGVDVPTPYASASNAILMDYIGDPDLPAPTLNTVKLDADEAQRLLDRVIWNIERMLAQGRVHGDLSAYNILYWEGQISLIDFPQAIDPEQNHNAYRIFSRDVARICEYFARQGAPANPARLAHDLWTAHGYRLQPEVHPRLLDDQDEGDRQYWQNLQNN
jgi:RIO kinase 1